MPSFIEDICVNIVSFNVSSKSLRVETVKTTFTSSNVDLAVVLPYLQSNDSVLQYLQCDNSVLQYLRCDVSALKDWYLGKKLLFCLFIRHFQSEFY